VLYGNADTNAAWTRLLGASPAIDVRRGAVRIGEQRIEGAGGFGFAVLPRTGVSAGEKQRRVLLLFDTGLAAARSASCLDPSELSPRARASGSPTRSSRLHAVTRTRNGPATRPTSPAHEGNGGAREL
jgi:hypothetical protein